MPEKIYTVYMHVNKVNGKAYVGCTRNNVKVRWGNGNGYMNRGSFWDAIVKYGWDNFEHKIIANCLTKEEAFNLETNLILKYNTANPEFGYNGTYGAGANENQNCITKTKHSVALKGRKHTYEHTNKMKANLPDRHGRNNVMYGKHHSDEAKAKMSLAKKHKYVGGNNPAARKVICLATREVFDTVIAAAKRCGMSDTTMRKYLKSIKGMPNWMYFDEYIEQNTGNAKAFFFSS